jgi:hypothetical protein
MGNADTTPDHPLFTRNLPWEFWKIQIWKIQIGNNFFEFEFEIIRI